MYCELLSKQLLTTSVDTITVYLQDSISQHIITPKYTHNTHSPAQAAKRPPPRVIPYHKHQEGKKRLAEVLKQQNQRTSTSSLDQTAVMKMLGSPDSPSSLQPPDDHAEKASLDSRGSTEASASVSSGEVATGTLVDLTGGCMFVCVYMYCVWFSIAICMEFLHVSGYGIV